VPDLIATLTSYVPALITRSLATDPAPVSAPVSSQFQAAVLFADISGFTALTERLAQKGPVGAEELTQLLNAYFGQLIDLVQVHGGDIVKFAGDALVALWPAGITDEDLATVTYRAAQCGLLVQAVLHDHPAGEGIRLTQRVGIGAGEVLVRHVGGVFGRWEFMVSGPPLAQIGRAGRLAQPGQVILSSEAWELVGDRCRGTPLPGEAGAALLEDVGEPLPFYARPAPALAAEAEMALRAYIPGAILARLAAGQSGWLAELRRVTVIFLNLPDLSHAIPLEQAQAVMRALQSTLYHYEGSINKLSVDEKGIMLVAALGLPPLAHEDDAARAVQAALAMQAELRRMNLRSALGITTGQAFCGSVGNSVRREYTMLGDVVNLAARLMQAAPDNILVDTATYHAAQSQVPLAFESLPPIQV
jgi:class 3 adenylate cyclase